MNTFLGIDQGGTKSQIAICDTCGNILGAAKGEGAVFYLDDPSNQSTATVRRLASTILQDKFSITAAYGGISGVDWPHEVAIHEARLRGGLGIENVVAVNDAFIALRAGSGAPNRCVVVGGTGLNIATRAEDGAEYAYGYYVPNRLQGGGALGNAVVEAVTEAATGVKPPTLLTDAALALTGCADVEEFLTKSTTRQIPFAAQSLYPCLLDAARAGDAAANQILDAFTADIAALVANALTRHLPPGCEAELVFSGGIFKGNGRVAADAISNGLSKQFPRLRFVNARMEPVCGALLMLLDRHFGGSIPDEVANRFKTGCEKHNLLRNMELRL